MVTQVQLYIEGDRSLREGFRAFLGQADRDFAMRGFKFRLVLCGDRARTLKSFSRGVEEHPDAMVLLLIDSDGPGGTHQLLQDVRRKIASQDSTAASMGDEQLHFMVQVMESWFLADRETLEEFYGSEFRASGLPQNERVEEIDKSRVERGLREATRRTQKGRYRKTQHARQLLERLDPMKVRLAARHCDRLFRALADVGG